MVENKIKSGVAFYEGSSWYHRIKLLSEDGSVKYSKKGGFSTEEEAETSYYECQEEFKRAVRNQMMKNPINTDIGFKDYLIYWFEDVYSERIETTTRMVGSYTLYSLIIPSIEKDIKLKYVTTEYLDELLKKISGICPSAGNKGKEFLNIAMKEAVAEGKIRNNPLINTRSYPRKSPSVIILSKDKIKLLLSASASSEWYLEILLALFCGLRKGEILGLKFEDIDFKNETVCINRQITANPIIPKGGLKTESYGIVEKPPKTENSNRKIRLPSIVLEEILKRKEKLDELKVRGSFEDMGYVSFRDNGLPHTVTSLNTALTKLCKKNGLPHITVHSLRHMYATILLEQGVALPKISALLGHSSVNTTFGYYCDQMDENRKIISFINDKFAVGEACYD